MKDSEYDYIFLGTGIISILEAVYQERCGKNVLMIDKDSDIGGAWQPINLFGIDGVENAIHYFLPDDRAPTFMRENLQWDVIKTLDKERLFKIPFINRYFRFRFHNPIGRFLSYLLDPNFNQDNKNFFKAIFNLAKKISQEKNDGSYYVVGGASKMMETIRSLVKHSSINIIFSTNITRINIDKSNQFVEIVSKTSSFTGSKLILSHGSRISSISSTYSNSKPSLYKVHEKLHPRPAVHLLVKDNHKTNINQWIFNNNKIIKYVHDLTHMIEDSNLSEGSKIFVFALHQDIKESENFYEILLDELINAGIVNSNSKVEDYLWTDVFLPTLYDEDLISIEDNFSPLISFLKTENFARGIGYYADKWSEKIKL